MNHNEASGIWLVRMAILGLGPWPGGGHVFDTHAVQALSSRAVGWAGTANRNSLSTNAATDAMWKDPSQPQSSLKPRVQMPGSLFLCSSS